MKLVRGAWRLLVGIKDALVLCAMLLFFGLLFAALNGRHGPRPIAAGALVLDLDGSIVEQPAAADLTAAFSGRASPRQYRLRDVLRAIDAAKDDDRVKVVVLDLEHFAGGYPETLNEVADALGRVRAAGKPVLAYADGYTDAGYRLAANASEVWMSPLGFTLFRGPGGSTMYYKGLIDKLGVNVHVYRVGKFKSFVEPYTRADESPESKEASTALYAAIFDQWKAAIAKARPKAQLAAYLTDPAALVARANGDFGQLNLRTGIVDKLGDRTAFGQRVAQLAGHDDAKAAGTYKAIDLDQWIDAHPLDKGGDAIGVVTVAGDIVDGKAGAGSAGGDTIAKFILDGLAKKDLKALVVRVDSPGGSAYAAERIRLALVEAKKQGLPVVVSMGGLAASGGYWVSTAADTIFAEPATITGSIGIFGILPTFEKALAKVGVTTDGTKTTPLSGQPDVFGGTTPALDAIYQAGIDQGYRQFLTRVAIARHMTLARADEIGQGRVWDGGSAHQLGLVDRFGSLSDAIAEAARRAKLDPAKVHAEYLEKKPGWADRLARSLMRRGPDDDDDAAGAAGDAFSRFAAERRDVAARALGDARRLATGAAVQARCLECAALAPTSASAGDLGLLDLVLAKLGLAG